MEKKTEANLISFKVLLNRDNQLITERTSTDIKKLEKKLTKENFNLLQSVIRSGTRELDSVHNKIEADLNARKG